ncbi:hypothetical protein KP509_25G010800 [Ceratopteris richardii]|uniref:Uncharacterized protein n=1 Tax=Ceratopteris richardii TaxID=49495 RepID=A0A8T2RMU3_CERRI|nr:hypothetical protein KP509_25G010800 [Ceratopteris richardii]
MPSLAVSSFDRLIDTAGSSASSQSVSPFDRNTPFSFYPPLYATPHQQRPPSPSSFSPSPYVLNFKRRPPVQNKRNDSKGSIIEASTDRMPVHQKTLDSEDDDTYASPLDPNRGVDVREILPNGTCETSRARLGFNESEVFEMELEKREPCFDRISDLAARKGFLSEGSLCGSLVANEEVEFFDAHDTVFHDSASEDDLHSNSKFGRDLNASTEGPSMRLAEELMLRRRAEAKTVVLERHWKDMLKQCPTLGVPLDFETEHLLENATCDVFSQEVVVARLVSGAIARAITRAEKDEEIDCMLALKNKEIARLCDKLQYLELVNREMSQRNLEVTELAQRRRRRRQRRQRIAITGFCATLLIGTAGLLCHRYAPLNSLKIWAKTFHKYP